MSTNNEVMTAALRKINVIAEGQTISGEQGLAVLPILNDMIEEWTERDIEIGYFAQSDPTADCPIPKWTERAVKANLAIAAAPIFGDPPITAALAQEAKSSFDTVQTKCMAEKMTEIDMSHMPWGSGHCGPTDITQ